MNAKDKLLKARVQIGLRYPFYSFIATRMVFYESDSGPTAWTDGRDMWYNPAFIDTLTIEQCVGLIVHEVLHCCWLHPLRLLGRNPTLWNVATDIVINHLIIDQKITLPEKGIYGPQYAKYHNWGADEVYNDLRQNAQEISGPGWGGFVLPTDPNGQPLTKEEISQIESEMKIQVAQAANYAKSRGNLPAGLEGLIEAVGKPKVNWQAYLQNWVKGHRPDNYTWNRPNRHMMSMHRIYMPRMELRGAGVGVLSIDTSGSVSDDELRAYVREIAGVVEMCNPDKLIIIQHDAKVQRVDEWEAGESFDSLKTKGRGGTCIAPVFRHLETLDEEIDWMILFTDMGIADWPKPQDWPDYPVIMCATGKDTSPSGTGAIYLPLKDAMQM